MSGMTILQVCQIRTIVFLASALGAQQGRAQAPVQVLNPHYVTISDSIAVNAPVVGKMLRNMKKLCEGQTLTPEDKQAPVGF
jgi:hypothetical protein